MAADDALMRCARKTVAMLTRETSELIGRPPNRMTLRTSAVTVLLCYFTYLHESNLKLTFLHILYINTTVNMTKVVSKIFQGNAVK